MLGQKQKEQITISIPTAFKGINNAVFCCFVFQPGVSEENGSNARDLTNPWIFWDIQQHVQWSHLLAIIILAVTTYCNTFHLHYLAPMLQSQQNEKVFCWSYPISMINFWGFTDLFTDLSTDHIDISHKLNIQNEGF